MFSPISNALREQLGETLVDAVAEYIKGLDPTGGWYLARPVILNLIEDVVRGPANEAAALKKALAADRALRGDIAAADEGKTAQLATVWAMLEPAWKKFLDIVFGTDEGVGAISSMLSGTAQAQHLPYYEVRTWLEAAPAH